MDPDATKPRRYRSDEEDSARWLGFPFRDGDIVISARSKSGTTWMQRICAALVLGSAELPAPLSMISPWLDWQVEPRDEVVARLAAQGHRRFIKTHTPLDGLPVDDRVTYIVVARDPLDAAVSLYHQGRNLNRARIAELTGAARVADTTTRRPDVRTWLRSWIDRDADPRESLDSLPGFVWHLSDAWARRGRPNVLLVHYDDLCHDLEGQMRRLAEALSITVPDDAWEELVDAATFSRMRHDAASVAPAPPGVLNSPAAFFRRGSSGAARELLSDDYLARYRDRIERLAAAEVRDWLLRT